MKMKFYQKKWVLWLLLIFLPPIGIILLWATQKDKNIKSKTALSIVFSIWFIVIIIGGHGNNQNAIQLNNSSSTSTEIAKAFELETSKEKTETEISLNETAVVKTETQKTTDIYPQNNEMKVHFLDVGQGLSILVQLDGKNLIYDGGDREYSSFVVSYLKKQGVTDIDYLISSHYDSDHLAGLIGCLNAFNVHNVISSDYDYDSKLYQSFIDTATDKGLPINHPAVGTEYPFGSSKFTILSPSVIASDSNTNSVAIKLENGSNRFIFVGDADHKSESDMCASELDLKCDVLSLGHHGSATSTSYDFLQATIPEFAVISCGVNNQYGHPDKDTMDKLQSMEIDVYRSDKQGTVTATSDGVKITWDTTPCNDYLPGDAHDIGTQPQKAAKETKKETVKETEKETQAAEQVVSGSLVWKSETGSKYHSISDCGRMNPAKATQITQQEAEAMGLDPCSKCF